MKKKTEIIKLERDVIAFKLIRIFSPKADYKIKSIWFAVAVQLLKVKNFSDYDAILTAIDEMSDEAKKMIRSFIPNRNNIVRYFKSVVKNTFFEVKAKREKIELSRSLDFIEQKDAKIHETSKLADVLNDLQQIGGH